MNEMFIFNAAAVLLNAAAALYNVAPAPAAAIWRFGHGGAKFIVMVNGIASMLLCGWFIR